MAVYRNPETKERKVLGGGDIPRKARALEAQGWELVKPKGFDPTPQPPDDFLDLPGVNAEIDEALRAVGFDSFDEIRAAADEGLLAISGIGQGRLAQIREALSEGVHGD